jgi:predicted alpha/beta-fold hydrolase
LSLQGLLAALVGAILASGLPMRLANWMTPQEGTVTRAGLRYAEGARGLLDLVLPVEVTPATPLLVFFHGGSWE